MTAKDLMAGLRTTQWFKKRMAKQKSRLDYYMETDKNE